MRRCLPAQARRHATLAAPPTPVPSPACHLQKAVNHSERSKKRAPMAHAKLLPWFICCARLCPPRLAVPQSMSCARHQQHDQDSAWYKPQSTSNPLAFKVFAFTPLIPAAALTEAYSHNR